MKLNPLIGAVAGGALVAGLLIGHVATGTPDSCLQALDASEQQYSTLQGVLPVAAEAVDAALYRSVARLDASTAKINIIKGQLDKQQANLDKTKEQCRG